MKKLMVSLFIVTLIIGIGGIANATLTVASTGDLGINVLIDGGDFDVYLDLIQPSNSLPAELVVKYGLYNSPEVPVDVYLNNNLLGDFTADSGYISPGPEFANFNITGLLLTGINHVKFMGTGSGDYVIGQVDIEYDSGGTSVPEPISIFLLGVGLIGIAGMRGKLKK